MTLCVFEPLQVCHFDLLVRWLQEPHVTHWWSDGKVWDYAGVEQKYQSYTQHYTFNEYGLKKPIYPFVIFIEGMPIGYIQFYNLYDFARDQLNAVSNLLPHSCAALDFYLGDPAFLGKGLGVTILQQFLEKKVALEFSACYVDPKKNNIAAIKTYERAGFFPLTPIPESLHIIPMLTRFV